MIMAMTMMKSPGIVMIMGAADEKPANTDRLTGESGVFAYLPRAMVALLPEIDAIRARDLDREPAASCGDCVKVPTRYGVTDHADHPWAFHESIRCCTYHPTLANFLVGRALRRGGPGAERIRARLADSSGVSPEGITSSHRYRALRQEARGRYFGRDARLVCPYWVGGTYACGIWRDRDGVCRTWFCKHQHGSTGLAHFTAVRAALARIETALARYCIARIPAPADDRSAWQPYFVACADLIDGLPDDVYRQLAETCDTPGDRTTSGPPLSGPSLVQLRRTVRQRAAALPDRPFEPSDVLVPVITHWMTTERGLALEGYSDYDSVEVPAVVLEVFVELDGQRSWHAALHRAHRRCHAAAVIDETIVRELARADVLRDAGQVRREHRAEPPGNETPRDGADHPAAAAIPETPVLALQRPITVGSRVWLQGAVPLGSMLAQSGIFELLSRLDGQTSWRDALAAANDALDASGATPLAERIVRQLHHIGGLQPP